MSTAGMLYELVCSAQRAVFDLSRERNAPKDFGK
jgi:hypothetical protein